MEEESRQSSDAQPYAEPLHPSFNFPSAAEDLPSTPEYAMRVEGALPPLLPPEVMVGHQEWMGYSPMFYSPIPPLVQGGLLPTTPSPVQLLTAQQGGMTGSVHLHPAPLPHSTHPLSPSFPSLSTRVHSQMELQYLSPQQLPAHPPLLSESSWFDPAHQQQLLLMQHLYPLYTLHPLLHLHMQQQHAHAQGQGHVEVPSQIPLHPSFSHQSSPYSTSVGVFLQSAFPYSPPLYPAYFPNPAYPIVSPNSLSPPPTPPSPATPSSPSSAPATAPPDAKLIVRYLPPSLTPTQFHSLFQRVLPLLSSNLILHRTTHLSLGYGFLQYATPDEARHVQQVMHGAVLVPGGRPIGVFECKAPPTLDVKRTVRIEGWRQPVEMEVRRRCEEFGGVEWVHIGRGEGRGGDVVVVVRFDSGHGAHRCIEGLHVVRPPHIGRGTWEGGLLSVKFHEVRRGRGTGRGGGGGGGGGRGLWVAPVPGDRRGGGRGREEVRRGTWVRGETGGGRVECEGEGMGQGALALVSPERSLSLSHKEEERKEGEEGDLHLQARATSSITRISALD